MSGKKGRRRKRILKETVEVKERRKMADKTLGEGGNSEGSGKGDDNKKPNKNGEEEYRRRLRSTWKKSGEGKDFKGEKTGMRNFLEKGNVVREEGEILRGNELKRTPIKKKEEDKEALEADGNAGRIKDGREEEGYRSSAESETEGKGSDMGEEGVEAEERSGRRETITGKVRVEVLSGRRGWVKE